MMPIKFNTLKGALAWALPLVLGVGPCERMPGGVLNGRVADTPVRMNRITDSDKMQAPWKARREMRGGEEPAPSIPESYWLFRLTSR